MKNLIITNCSLLFFCIIFSMSSNAEIREIQKQQSSHFKVTSYRNRVDSGGTDTCRTTVTISGPTQICIGSPAVTLTATASCNQHYLWYKYTTAGFQALLGQTSSTLSALQGRYYVRAWCDSCLAGNSAIWTLTGVPCATPLFTISPNPGITNVNIRVAKSESSVLIKEVRLINKFGKILIVKQYPSGIQKVSLNVSGITPDVYEISISDGTSWETEQFIKQ